MNIIHIPACISHSPHKMLRHASCSPHVATFAMKFLFPHASLLTPCPCSWHLHPTTYSAATPPYQHPYTYSHFKPAAPPYP